MPGTTIEQAGRRVLQCLAKSISAVMIESDACVVPSTQRHDPAEKHWCIFQGIASRFPPTNAAGYGSQFQGTGRIGLRILGARFHRGNLPKQLFDCESDRLRVKRESSEGSPNADALHPEEKFLSPKLGHAESI
jgi:hypothetical protein